MAMTTDLPTLLKERASLTRDVRQFFERRGVLEVTTPLLSRAAVTDPSIESLVVAMQAREPRYLRTSPEFPLKRLLSAGAPDVFELGPVFRDGESGRWHNPEFMLLEWYRRGFGMQQLVDEVVELVQSVSGKKFSEYDLRQMRYYDAFDAVLGVDVREQNGDELERIARRESDVPEGPMDTDQWLDFLFSTQVQPQFPDRTITVVTHYPASQAALARLDPGCCDTALRFEVFVGAVELANGFEELDNEREQAIRFDHDNAVRMRRGQRPMPVDRAFLDSLDQLPECSGVALGFDRLLMLTEELESISKALAIAWDDA